MAKGFNLIVPTILETDLTGFIGAIEKVYRGCKYRVEFFPSGLVPMKDGRKLRSFEEMPSAVQRAARSGRETLAQAAKLKEG
jgi:hypothetical protein